MEKKKTDTSWVTSKKQDDKSMKNLQTSFQYNRQYLLAKDKYTSTPHDNFMALSIAIRDRIVEHWIITQQRYHNENPKRVYYLSMEFLMGRLLKNNIINIRCENEVKEALGDLSLDLEEIYNQESDAGLGNGGLGRLAACFLDSMATLGIPAHGYGIRYDYGIFNQKIVNGFQVEYPDEWLKKGNPWEFVRPEYAVTVHFYGHTQMAQDNQGKLTAKWVDTENVLAMPYDVPVVGYNNQVVNTLRLWSARSTEEFDFKSFNFGDYERSVYNKVLSENISKVLYPNDNVYQGRELRLKQEYFFVAASISDIIRRFKAENTYFRHFPDKNAIQLNDTHPALAIVELMRILLDDIHLEWEDAWDITVRTFAYTNHTLMPEALEKWPVPLMENVLPRHLQIIYEINSRFLREISTKFPDDVDRQRRMSLIEEATPHMVRMAFLAVVGSHSVNGVSELHSALLKTNLFRDFYEVFPDKFNNKTNGITQRRWLRSANPKLSHLITEGIGDKWVTDLFELKKILPLKDDSSFRESWQECKTANKETLAKYIKDTAGVTVNPESMFDVQVKRIHEYKRQLLFCLFIIAEYLKIKKNPNSNVQPRTFIFGGKSAPGYQTAKLIIKFINNVADIINKDKDIHDLLKVIFLENYGVSLAELIFPASELSEQISTAGTEASGTGCMKFMMNGALTIATLDGANIEMMEAVGQKNMFIFGLKTDEIQKLRAAGYNPQNYISRSPALKETLDLIRNNYFSVVEMGLFEPILQTLNTSDPFFVCADFNSYLDTQAKVSKLYQAKDEWIKTSIINVAESGKFSTDRTIMQYADDIWKVSYRK